MASSSRIRCSTSRSQTEVKGACMLGIGVYAANDTTTYVFVCYTQSGGQKDGDDLEGIEPAGNRLYRYEWQDGKLVNPRLLIDLPAGPGCKA